MEKKEKLPRGLRKIGNDYWLDYFVRGRRKREKVGLNKTLAITLLGKRRAEIKENRFFDIRRSEKVYFKDISERFLEYSRINKRSYKRDTELVGHLKSYFGDRFLYEITPPMIESYRNLRLEQGVSKATVNREVACLKHIFNKAIFWNKAKENPVKKIRMFQENNTIVRYLSEDEKERLLKACKISDAPHLYPIVITALNTGMRRGEILSLQWRDIDFTNGFIHIENSKSGKRRDIPANTVLTNTLKFGIKKPNTDYVFCDEKGKPLQRLERSFGTALKRAGISKFRFHDLRHTFASYLVMAGVDIYTVSKLLGHSSVKVTERYAHLSPKHNRMAVELLGAKFNSQSDTKTDTWISKNPAFKNS